MKSGSLVVCFHLIGLIENFLLLKENGQLFVLMDEIDMFKWTSIKRWMQFGCIMMILITLMSTHFNMCLQFRKWKVHHLCIKVDGFNIYVRITFGFNDYLQKDCQPCRGLFFQFCMKLRWQYIIHVKWLRQIWLQTRNESEKKWSILLYYLLPYLILIQYLVI
jgi:hypothetical protein